jgi:D-alanyl-D-alanine endopeptidase (penicillin-binding protein 7)
MGFWSHFFPRKALLAPIVCMALAMPALQVFAQNSSTSSTNQNAKKKTNQTQKSSNKVSSTSNKKNTNTKKTTKTATKPSNNAVRAAAGPATMGAVRSNVVFVQDLSTQAVLYSRNEDGVRPIASISKLMTAVIVVDANQPMDEMLEVTQDDVDVVKHSRSRLAVGTRLSRRDMLHLALMSSENRAANALARYYPGGMTAFVAAMNTKARSLGMTQTRFVEPTGLSSDNVSTPRDLVKLLQASASRPAISDFTTDEQYEVRTGKRAPTTFRNTNMLVANPSWDIKVSKTGFINEAGQCLVMVARMNNRDVAIVLLNAEGKGTRIGDAVKIKQLVQTKQMASL